MTSASLFRQSPRLAASVFALGGSLVSSALAQTVPVPIPDAGQVLREQAAPSVQAPRPAGGLRLAPAPAERMLPGGATVNLKAVRVTGNSVLTEAQLLAHLGEVAGQPFDGAGLRGLAERVAEAYHAAGYPFARAYLPQQDLSSGQLSIEVIEGRYGEVKARGDAALAPQVQGFLSRLIPGQPIEGAALERATLLLDDLPGIKTAPVMRPGTTFGTGNLEVEVSRTRAVRGDVSYDNHGNRYTGEHRLRANVSIDSPFMLGDQLQFSALYGSENLWLGNLGYSLPLGTDGWRANVGYAQTNYELGKEFAATQARGTAQVSTWGVSYPLARSQALNLSVAATLQHKALHDEQATAGMKSDKRSNSLPISLQFDQRDALGGGGVTYGTLSLTAGHLQLDGSLQAQDASSGVNTRGNFHKWNLDVARLQATPVSGLSLFARLSGQQAHKNLDSSEKFGLGGPSGVRSSPTGEGFGDEGWLGQVELRYALGAFNPYAFYDAGSVRLHAKPESLSTPVSTNQRTMAGAGLGARYQRGAWSADLSVGWRTEGIQAQSADTRRNPRAWLTIAYRV